MKFIKQKFTLFFIAFLLSFYVGSTQGVTNIYVNPNIGNDANDGSKEQPLRSLPAASRLVNESEGENGVTIFLSQGVYALMEPSTFHPTKRKFTKRTQIVSSSQRIKLRPAKSSYQPHFIISLQIHHLIEPARIEPEKPSDVSPYEHKLLHNLKLIQ